MLQLGYEEYVSQGGDWGAIISEILAVQAPKGLLGIHVNMPGTVPPDVLRHLRNFDPAPSALSDRERIAYDRLLHFYRDGFGYAALMNQSPQTIGYALADSPVAMAAYRSEEHTSELQSLMRLSYAVFCLKKKIHNT